MTAVTSVDRDSQAASTRAQQRGIQSPCTDMVTGAIPVLRILSPGDSSVVSSRVNLRSLQRCRLHGKEARVIPGSVLLRFRQDARLLFSG